jgi:hypothetical protein
MLTELKDKLNTLIAQAEKFYEVVDSEEPKDVGPYRSFLMRIAKFIEQLGYPQWQKEAELFLNFDKGYIDEEELNLLLSTLLSIKDYFEHEKFDENFISRPPESPRKVSTRKIFIVHGHDTEITTETARFLEKLTLQPIILHEQPDQGQTIIEKFEAYSDVGFAVVLLTPDDVGAKQTESENLKARARQNVILELGYFLGKLGRRSVASIYKSGVEIPSDYQGVLFIPYDKEGMWKLKLTKELKSAGMNLDMNLLAR